MRTFWKIEKIKSAFGLARELEIKPDAKLSVIEFFNLLDNERVTIYREAKIKTPAWIRITLPFALIVIVTLFILIPVNYMITGRWGYEYRLLTNWLRALGF